MALPASGAISLGAVNTELGVSATAARSLNDSTTRTLFGVASGGISLSNGHGKANAFSFTIASNQTNANLRTLAVNAGWNQSSKIVATINSGVYISSNSTGTPALTVAGPFPGGAELINNGHIIGMGGKGGNGALGFDDIYVADDWIEWTGFPGESGGPAISVSAAIYIRNNNTIAGGGGGGGGGAAKNGGTGYEDLGFSAAGGGGGQSSAAANSGIGIHGDFWGPALWFVSDFVYQTPANQGTLSGPGVGGISFGNQARGYPNTGDGGSGGAWGSNGGAGEYLAGEDPWFATIYSRGTAGSGGAGGAAVSGNGNVTWLVTGTRLGALT